ncbi:MAG: serine/threonine-protein kinase [Paracoccaceae bacterium]|nr:serine/threonine-protein kinase [Paracoccaceae bacterium]
MAEKDSAKSTSLTDEALPIGTTLLGDQFTIKGLLGAGGFGISYRAEDNTLGRTIVIKECFPFDICSRKGKNAVARGDAMAKLMRLTVEKFMGEARNLAKLRHPNIVGVHRAFEENETAYMALDLIEGRELYDVIKSNPTPSPAFVKNILMQLLDAVAEVHDMDLLHRDISPDNILIEEPETPVLIDFGAARADAHRHTRALSAFQVVKDGYSPHEFYVDDGKQMPSSDLYSLGATFYHLLSGMIPANSQTRLVEIASHRPDPCEPLAGRIEGYDETFLRAIDSAMNVHPEDRLQSAAKWRSLIAEVKVESVARSSFETSSDESPLDLELTLSRLVEESNEEVKNVSRLAVEPELAVAPPKDVVKPEWIDDFNQETVESQESTEAEPEVPDLADPILDARGCCYAPEGEPLSTNWVDRSLKKQERVRQERASRLEMLDPETLGQTLLPDSEETLKYGKEAVHSPENAIRPRIQTFGVLGALLLCFGFLAFLNAVDKLVLQQEQAAVKSEFGKFEMRGSIIR